jgi:hypothetical protein
MDVLLEQSEGGWDGLIRVYLRPMLGSAERKDTNVSPDIKDDIAGQNKNPFPEIQFVHENFIQDYAGLRFIETIDFAKCRMGNFADGFLFFSLSRIKLTHL